MERTLGTQEQYWWRLGLSGAATANLVANVRGKISVERLEQALALTQKGNPLLSVRIEAKGGSPKFVVDPSVTPPLRVMERTDPDQWIAETEKELNTPFCAEVAPLFRVLLLKGDEAADVILTYHHAIMDGGVCFVFKDLFSFYEELLQGGDPQVERPRLSDAIDKRLPGKYRRLLLTRSVLKLIRRRLRRKVVRSRRLPYDETYAFDQPLRTRFIFRSLSLEESTKLLGVCRSHQTSFYGASVAAFLLAASRHLGDSPGQHLGLSSSVSLRKYLEPPIEPGEIRNAVAVVNTAHEVYAQRPFWELAAEARSELQQRIDHGELFIPGLFSRRLLLRLAKSEEQFIRSISKNMQFTVLVTSIGPFAIPKEYGSLTIEDLIGFPAIHVYRWGGIGLATHSFHGKIWFDFLYPDPLVDEGLVAEIANDTMAIVRERVSG